MGKKTWEEVIISDNDIVPGKKIIKTLGGVKVLCKSQSVHKKKVKNHVR